jgi:hypothetical protein
MVATRDPGHMVALSVSCSSHLATALVLATALACASNEDCTNCESNRRAAGSGLPQPSTEPTESPEPEPAPDVPPIPSAEPYANCLDGTLVCQHGAAPHCLVDDVDASTMAFCSSDCGSTQECPRAPSVSGATPECLTLDGVRGECVLDCLEGKTCPEGMVCLPFGVCGFVTEDAENPYGTCDVCSEGAVGCLSNTLGEACLPHCDGCPSPRNGGVLPTCGQVDGQWGCVLQCDGVEPCPDGMVCTPAGVLSLCLWPHEDPCNQVECGPGQVCQIVASQPGCVCQPGLLPNQAGECVDPCDLLQCDPSAHCERQGLYAYCECDSGEYLDQDLRCVPLPEDPCDPNPCQEPTTRCVLSEYGASCECPDPDTFPPTCAAGCVLHYDGDAYEPNDCPENSTRVGAGEAALGPSRVEADFGPELGDVDLYRLAQQPGLYWVLLESTAAVCDLDFVALPEGGEFGGFTFGVQLRADQQPAWACRYREELAEAVAYSLGVLYFPVYGDLPDEVGPLPMGSTSNEANPPLPGGFEVADEFGGHDDVDVFVVRVELPGALSFTGQRATINVEVYEDDEQSTAPDVECGFSLDPERCLDVAGDGPATLIVRVRQAESASQGELDAWRIGWLSQ